MKLKIFPDGWKLLNHIYERYQIHRNRLDNKDFNKQFLHWEKSFATKPEMFGLEPSYSAKIALENFKKNNIKHIIELGAGLGRDTIFFAKNSIKVTSLDFSSTAIEIIKNKSISLGVSNFINPKNII